MGIFLEYSMELIIIIEYGSLNEISDICVLGYIWCDIFGDLFAGDILKCGFNYPMVSRELKSCEYAYLYSLLGSQEATIRVF